MFKIVVQPRARKALRKMPAKDRANLEAKIKLFASDPYASHSFAERMTGIPRSRIRAGNWRAVVEVRAEEVTVFVIDAGDRKNVYR